MEKILLVEDTKSTIDLINTTLSENGYAVSVATSGIQALKIVDKLKPDLILMDILMPGMDGYETCSKIKQSETSRNTPVIFLSALTQSIDKVKAFQSGGVDFISKPIENEELMARIRTHLTISRLQKQQAQANEKLEEMVKVRTNELHEINTQLQSSINELFDKSRALEESKERYKHITTSITDYIYKTFLRDGKVVKTVHSPTCYAVLGYTAEELNQDKTLWAEIIHPNDRQKDKDFMEEFFNGSENNTIEFRILRKDGQVVWISNTLLAYHDDKGNLIAYDGIMKDITLRKDLEKKILATTIETEERERQRFAQELHDGLGPLLSASKMYLQWIAKTEDREDIPNLLKKTISLIDDAHKTSREISHNLSPHILQNFGFLAALRNFIERTEILNLIKVNITDNCNEGKNSFPQLGLPEQTIIYRVITESINNTLKHAHATSIGIVIDKSENLIEIDFSDNGVGFDVEKTMTSQKGLGLFNMKNRIESINGTFNIQSQPNKGTNIKIQIGL